MNDTNINTRFTKEEFNKLSQLDRIEYRQREDRINDSLESISAGSFFYNMFSLDMLIFILGVASYDLSKNLSRSVISAIPILLKITLLGTLILFMINIYTYYKKKQAIQDLKKEYFDIDVHTKKKVKE